MALANQITVLNIERITDFYTPPSPFRERRHYTEGLVILYQPQPINYEKYWIYLIFIKVLNKSAFLAVSL